MVTQGKCPNCGASISIEDDKKSGYCRYCGTECLVEEIQTVNEYHTTQNIVKNYYGNDPIDNSVYIKNGEVFLSLGEYTKASENFMKAININPSDYRGWFGIVKSKTWNLTNFQDENHLKFYEKAKKVATEEQILEMEDQYKEKARKWYRKNKGSTPRNVCFAIFFAIAIIVVLFCCL